MSDEARVGNPEDRHWLLQESGGYLSSSSASVRRQVPPRPQICKLQIR